MPFRPRTGRRGDWQSAQAVKDHDRPRRARNRLQGLRQLARCEPCRPLERAVCDRAETVVQCRRHMVSQASPALWDRVLYKEDTRGTPEPEKAGTLCHRACFFRKVVVAAVLLLYSLPGQYG